MGILNEMLRNRLVDIHGETGKLLSSAEIAEMVDNAMPKVTEHLLEALKKDTPEMLRYEQECGDGFRSRLGHRWKKGFDLLTGLGVMCREAGEMAQDEIRAELEPPEIYRFEALNRLHARACLIYQEILCLLNGGFADGAMGRWRSLHETATVALFLSEHDPSVAEAFLEHQFVEQHKRLLDYQRHADALGLDPFEPDEVSTIQDGFRAVLARHGAQFKNDYGWASAKLQKDKVYFSDIERKVGIEHLRPYYKWACEKIHSSANGLYRPLGIFDRDNVMLAGPSNHGLADPAQLAAQSLFQATVAFISGWGTLDLHIVSHVCHTAASGIGEVFLQIQLELEEEEAALQAEQEGGEFT